MNVQHWLADVPKDAKDSYSSVASASVAAFFSVVDTTVRLVKRRRRRPVRPSRIARSLWSCAGDAQILEKIDPRQRHSLTEQAFLNMERQIFWC
jgi:hypothetical protein